jgi:hypothetical protein
MRPLPEAGAKLEPQLWGTQTEAQNEPQLGGGLPGVKPIAEIQQELKVTIDLIALQVLTYVQGKHKP